MTAERVRAGLRSLLETVVLVLMLALAATVVVGVGFRKAGASLVWYDEVASILLAWLTFYGGALAALHRAHIGMPTLVARLRGPVRIAVILVGEVVVLGFFGVLAWAGLRVLTVLGGTSLVSLPWMPAAVPQSVIPIGAALFILAQLLSLPQVLAPVPEVGATSPGEATGAPDEVRTGPGEATDQEGGGPVADSDDPRGGAAGGDVEERP